MTLLVLMIVVFAVIMSATGAGRGCGWRGRHRVGRRWDAALNRPDEVGVPRNGSRRGPLARGESDALQLQHQARSAASARQRNEPRARAESPEQRLQRQFVDGTLTVEEYERELDRLIRR